jgi:KaiC/GvpD/RAD55 family RecA-like ATPase
MRLPSGVAGMDKLLDGGLPAGRLYVVSGPPGSGKTTFCSHTVAENARAGRRTLYVSMHETADELVADMSQYEFGFDRVASSELLNYVDATSSKWDRMLETSTNQPSVSNVATRLRSMIDAKGYDLVIIDSTMLLRYMFSNGQDELVKFLTDLKSTDSTVLLISEMTDPSKYEDEHYLASGVLFFHNFMKPEGMTRGLQVLKMRGTDIDTDIHELSFSREGLTIASDRRVKA